MKIQNKNTFEAHLNQGVNLFLGAGFSIAAKGIFEGKPKNLPVGDYLRQELLSRFNRPKTSKLSLAQLCQIISTTQKDDLNNFFRERFNVIEFDNLYKNLERISLKSIFTTNIDNLVFKIFEDSHNFYVNDISTRGPSMPSGTAIDYIALHGCINYPDSNSMDFSPIEIASSFERDKDKWFGYINRIQKTPTIYWGYKIEDAGVLQALSKEASGGKEKADSWIVLRSTDEESIEYFSSMGFQIIEADTVEFLKYLGQLKKLKSSDKSKLLIERNFKEYFLPTQNSVSVRSLNEFYLGAEPVWYDIYFGNLHKTDHFSKIKDSIHGDKNCIIIGSAVTGKSTLLRQLAVNFNGEFHSLFIEEISPEKAHLLKKDIDAEGAKVLLFIDNAADSWESINILRSSSNIKIIIAERDYIYDSVAHRFPTNYSIFDVTGLNKIDIQSIIDKIPNGVQRINKPFFETASNKKQIFQDFDPSFLEVLDSKVYGHFLSERFIESIYEIKEESDVKYDLITLACYMYMCRVPMSTDVAISYLGSKLADKTQITALLGSMSSILSNYSGEHSDASQDFFVPRSRAVAETVIRGMKVGELKYLLVRFHENISTTKITRYDIFKRMAYDANLTNKAFPNWKEGLEFYEKCLHRDQSHSFKQQAAIYLSRKKQTLLAFKWIDEALSIAGNRAASVKNTYAVILFNANYEKNGSEIVRSLDDSMNILRDCYKDDLKKIYHAKVFADQAIKYFDKFKNSELALSYLDEAEEWLKSESKLRTGDRSIGTLLRSLKSRKRQVKK